MKTYDTDEMMEIFGKWFICDIRRVKRWAKRQVICPPFKKGGQGTGNKDHWSEYQVELLKSYIEARERVKFLRKQLFTSNKVTRIKT